MKPLPCPFCGSPAEKYTGKCREHAYSCSNQTCEMWDHTFGVKTWNSRFEIMGKTGQKVKWTECDDQTKWEPREEKNDG